MAVLNDLGDVALSEGDLAQATRMYAKSLSQAWELSSKRDIAWRLESLARVATLQGQYERAAFLLGAAEPFNHTNTVRLLLDDIAKRERMTVTVRAALDESIFAAKWQQGATATLEDAVAYALNAPRRALHAE
jgi:hypothetical protein